MKEHADVMRDAGYVVPDVRQLGGVIVAISFWIGSPCSFI
jgi:hypothetical protein